MSPLLVAILIGLIWTGRPASAAAAKNRVDDEHAFFARREIRLQSANRKVGFSPPPKYIILKIEQSNNMREDL